MVTPEPWTSPWAIASGSALGGGVVALILRELVWPTIQRRVNFAIDERWPLHPRISDDARYLLLATGKSVNQTLRVWEDDVRRFDCPHVYLGTHMFVYGKRPFAPHWTTNSTNVDAARRIGRAFDELQHIEYFAETPTVDGNCNQYRLNPNGIERCEYELKRCEKRRQRQRILAVEAKLNAFKVDSEKRAKLYFERKSAREGVNESSVRPPGGSSAGP